MDKYFCINRKTQTCTERCRHPATHSPITLFFSIIILKLITSGFLWSNFIVEAFSIAIGSHLLLDIFSQEGIPLGFVPTLFVQDPNKNYVFNDHSKARMRLLIPSSRINRDNLETDHYIGLSCKILVIFLCIQLLFNLQGGIV